MLWRGQRTNVYHECQRCGVRQPLSNMRWQNGILVCQMSGCVDTAIVGSRDMNVVRQISVDRRELEIDEKLVNPVARKNDMLEVLY